MNTHPVTHSHRKPFFAWTGALAFVALLLVILSSFVNRVSVSSLALNKEALAKELQDLTIAIQLSEVAYHQSVGQTINTALNEIKNSKTSHLSTITLQKEKAVIESQTPSSEEKEIDALLNKVLF